jgi:hypothetical protein
MLSNVFRRWQGAGESMRVREHALASVVVVQHGGTFHHTARVQVGVQAAGIRWQHDTFRAPHKQVGRGVTCHAH